MYKKAPYAYNKAKRSFLYAGSFDCAAVRRAYECAGSV